MRTRNLVIGLLLLVLASQAAAFAGGTVFEGDGLKLNLVFGPWYYSISADEACWVRHGVSIDRFPGMQREVKDDMGTNQIVDTLAYYMRLFIDGKEIELKMNMITTPPGLDGEPGRVNQKRLWHVQFPPYYFEAGMTYTLTLEIGAKNPNAYLVSVYGLPIFLDTTLEVTAP